MASRTDTGPVAPRADLLQYLSDTALDADYARVTAARGAPVTSTARRRGIGPALGALLAFGMLVALAAVQTRSGASEAERESEALRAQIDDGRADFAALTGLSNVLQQQVADLQGTAETASQNDADLLADLGRFRTLTGAAAVSGPGVRVVADDAERTKPGGEGAVLDTDLQVLVNGLWQAGAEAIAINGNRISPLSAIRGAGFAITVNYRSLSPPYAVQAVGDSATLEARFVDTPGGQAWLDLETNFGLRFDMDTVESLSLPAAPAARLRVLYAERQGELP
ncbi:MAG: DUF881 domain-containing protein [Nocardioidaceae bacterium]|nr:DUF881 domain-containing protein [Nocardioidaceae bacterium]